MNDFVYFDNAATTQMSVEVFNEMKPYLTNVYANASSLYSIGRNSKKYLEKSRQTIAACFGSKANEIFFTSGGTESNNWAILGSIKTNKKRGKHIITSSIEHHSILNVLTSLKDYDITYLTVNSDGIISLKDLQEAIRPDTILISIMFANNEIGTIQPIKEIGQIAKKHNILFHTDAVAALPHISIDVNELQIDLMSVSSHKIYGPKGVGILYIRSGVNIFPLIVGGAQEKNKRAGTENIAGAVGMAKALQIIKDDLKDENNRLFNLRQKLINGILHNIPYCYLNGSKQNRLVSNVNVKFDFVPADSLLLCLDMENVFASAGSACSSGALEPSHVLLAMGLSHQEANNSVRFSLGKFNTENDIDKLLDVLPKIIANIRKNSSDYKHNLRLI